MKHLILICVLLSAFLHPLLGQEKSSPKINSLIINSLEDPALNDLLAKKMENTQFILLGEQHGVLEIGELMHHLYKKAFPIGFNTLCVETDALVASTINHIAGQDNPVAHASRLNQQFPFSIPFYGNPNDYKLFQEVKKQNGEIWGVDQVFMAEWRLYFHELAKNASNESFAKKASEMEEIAQAGLKEALEKKQFQAMGMFKFEDADYQALKALSTDPKEQKMVDLLARSHSIYMDNIQRRYYQNNYKRSQLMKENFMNHYRASGAQKPKVLFRMGAYHMGRGLTETKVYDIANLASELAEAEGKRSLHIMTLGIKGENTVGNPFTPTPNAPYSNIEGFAPEIKSLVENLSEKYLIIDTVPLRNQARSYSKELQKYLFRYDLLIFINDTHAYEELK